MNPPAKKFNHSVLERPKTLNSLLPKILSFTLVKFAVFLLSSSTAGVTQWSPKAWGGLSALRTIKLML